MKIPKCPKSVTGKHSFIKEIHQDNDGYRFDTGKIICDYCGMVDDRNRKKII